MTDVEKLEKLADWFNKREAVEDMYIDNTELCPSEIRRIAAHLSAQEREIAELKRPCEVKMADGRPCGRESNPCLMHVDKLAPSITESQGELVYLPDDPWKEINTLRSQLEAKERKLAELKARRFPIIGGPSIPWALIAPYESQAQANHDQTLEHLASRGGLSCVEAWCVMNNKSLREWKNVSDSDARQWLINLSMPYAQLEVKEREIRRLREACSAAVKYDEAIKSCGNDPEKMSSYCSVQGDDLDSLYFNWMTKAKAALNEPAR
jgi:hypothetical protein